MDGRNLRRSGSRPARSKWRDDRLQAGWRGGRGPSPMATGSFSASSQEVVQTILSTAGVRWAGRVRSLAVYGVNREEILCIRDVLLSCLALDFAVDDVTLTLYRLPSVRRRRENVVFFVARFCCEPRLPAAHRRSYLLPLLTRVCIFSSLRSVLSPCSGRMGRFSHTLAWHWRWPPWKDA